MSEFWDKDKRIYNFKESIEAQKPYRERFMEWLKSRPKVKQVKETTLDDDLQGIDFYVSTEDGEEYTLQLKVDGWADKTGNLPCEAISQAYSWRDSVIGAEFKMSEVDYIFFLLIPSERILAYRFKPFLEYTIQHYESFRNFGADNDNNGVQYRTLGCLVPIRKIRHLVVINTRLE